MLSRDCSHLLVNTADPYDGRVIIATGVVLIEVNAEGGWPVTFELLGDQGWRDVVIGRMIVA